MVPTSDPLWTEPVGPLLLIGRKEDVALPEWGIVRLRAKIDTGAYSSALGVSGLRVRQTPAGRVVRFDLPMGGAVEAPLMRMVRVRCSSGRSKLRPLVEAVIRLGPVTRRVRLTLTDRSRMRCRLLLGRQALAGHFLVDVRRKNLLQRAAQAVDECEASYANRHPVAPADVVQHPGPAQGGAAARP